MSDDPRGDFFASGAGPQKKALTRDDFFSGKLNPETLSEKKTAPESPSFLSQGVQHAKEGLEVLRKHPFTAALGTMENALGGVTGGFGSLAEALTGADPGAHDWAYRPRTEAGKEIARLAAEEGAKIGQGYDWAAGYGPLAQTLKERIPQAAAAISTAVPLIKGAGALGSKFVSPSTPLMEPVPETPAVEAPPEAPLTATGTPRAAPYDPALRPAAEAPATPLSATGAPRATPFEPQDIPGKPGVTIDTEPVEGGLGKLTEKTAPAIQERAAILSRVGLEAARDSALEGDAKAAATDWQLSKFDEPAGAAAKAHFDAERTALQKHAEGIIEKTGGTLGMDEDSLNSRGQTIARPFDDLADWFDQKRKTLYAAADARAQGAPVTNLDSVDALLKDPRFRNTLLAKDQGNLLSSIENQLAEFRKQSPGGFTVAGSEDFRQWLNQIWTNDNKAVIGRVKDVLDQDVLKGAGEDIYAPARALVQMKKQTLDNPSGINKLMEHDPQTPINRTTPHVKIADTIVRLDPAQFDNVIKTLQTMPEELQPQAQAAVNEIKAHLANKVYDAGNSTAGQWNARAVDKVIKNNSAKLQSAFADQPDVLQNIADLRSAGKILSVNQGYPGAAAQAANALKRGLMSRAVGKLAATSGAAAGGWLGGPFGAAGGAAVGESLGGKAAQSMAERAAVKQWNAKITSLQSPPSAKP